VYDVDDQMLAFMDHFEGHPEVYSRDKVRAHFVGNSSPETSTSTECWAYFLKGFPQALLYKETVGAYDAYSSKPYQPESVDFFFRPGVSTPYEPWSKCSVKNWGTFQPFR